MTHQSVDTNPNIPLTVEYDEIVKTWNTGLATPILLIVLPIWWYIIWRRRRYHYNSHEILVGTDGDDEIAVLERARAVMFAREATRAADTTKKTAPKKVTTKTTEKTATPVKKPARKKSAK